MATQNNKRSKAGDGVEASAGSPPKGSTPSAPMQ